MSTSPIDRGGYLLVATPPRGRGRLFVWLGRGEPLAPFEAGLVAGQVRFTHLPDQQGTAILLEDGEFASVAEVLEACLGVERVSNARAVFVTGDAAPNWRDLAHARPLSDFVAVQRALWLLELVDGDRLTSHFQPIVHAQDTSRVFAQEALLRAYDAQGGLVPPFRMFGAARAAGLLPLLDGEARRTALAEVSRHQLPHRVFVNLNPAAVRDPATCLAGTLAQIDALGVPRDRVVFELVESDHNGVGTSLEGLRAFFAAEGFKLALDDLGSGYSSLNLIHRLRPDYVKLDMELIRNVDQDPYKAAITRKLLELTSELGIETIAEGVETAGELLWLRGTGATYVQGYLIAKPGSPPLLHTPALGGVDKLAELTRELPAVARRPSTA